MLLLAVMGSHTSPNMRQAAGIWCMATLFFSMVGTMKEVVAFMGGARECVSWSRGTLAWVALPWFAFRPLAFVNLPVHVAYACRLRW